VSISNAASLGGRRRDWAKAQIRACVSGSSFIVGWKDGPVDRRQGFGIGSDKKAFGQVEIQVIPDAELALAFLRRSGRRRDRQDLGSTQVQGPEARPSTSSGSGFRLPSLPMALILSLSKDEDQARP
jgi:hypothetical protein